MNRAIIIWCLVFLSGCAALQSPRPGMASRDAGVTLDESSAAALPVASATVVAVSSSDESPVRALDTLLRQHAGRWLNTPYQFGGVSHEGVDCSGLIQRVYADALGVALPRTTSQQLREGKRVRRGRAIPGDLVFFEPPGKSRHAGIVLADRQFLHASSSRGVMISPLDEGYWSQHEMTVRRILSEDELPLVLSRHERGRIGVPDLTER